jgi:hypothetical protein
MQMQELPREQPFAKCLVSLLNVALSTHHVRVMEAWGPSGHLRLALQELFPGIPRQQLNNPSCMPQPLAQRRSSFGCGCGGGGRSGSSSGRSGGGGGGGGAGAPPAAPSLDTRFSRALLFQRLQQVLGAGFEPRVEQELRSSELPFARQVLDV